MVMVAGAFVCTAAAAIATPTMVVAVEGSLARLRSTHDGEATENWESVRWPPAACAAPQPSPVVDRSGPPLRGAWGMFCDGSRAFHHLWARGVRLLGDLELVNLIERSEPLHTKFAGRGVTIWHDGRDREAVHSVSPLLRRRWKLNLHCRNLTHEDWLLDIGGHLGETAIDAQLRAPAANIVTVEPSPWNCFLLHLNLLVNLPQGHRTTALCAGIARSRGSFLGQHTFARSWWSGDGDAGGRPREGSGNIEAVFNATLITLPMLLHRFKISRVVWLKLNCLGCEWGAVLSLKQSGLWNRIHHVAGMLNPVGGKLLPGQEVEDVREFLPVGLAVSDALVVFGALCNEPKSIVPMCSHPKLTPLNVHLAEFA
eukprot:TRINITY_DN9423_c2_g1_i1.p1 TRINITY_DN9423_c2_g1~~TRINITY_DN9423_c2_g1_i1.p1  ORF type:complete len:370 (+),score=37.55 TRINITY_DN9423_c2_g1_i1:65-1174(+)